MKTIEPKTSQKIQKNISNVYETVNLPDVNSNRSRSVQPSRDISNPRQSLPVNYT